MVHFMQIHQKQQPASTSSVSKRKKKTVADWGRIQEIAYNIIVLGATKGAITLLIVGVSGKLQALGTASQALVRENGETQNVSENNVRK